MLKTPFIQREGSKRTLLLLIMVSMLLGFTSSGSGQLFFFFVREKLQWTLPQFTSYGTVVNVLGLVGKDEKIHIGHLVNIFDFSHHDCSVFVSHSAKN